MTAGDVHYGHSRALWPALDVTARRHDAGKPQQDAQGIRSRAGGVCSNHVCERCSEGPVEPTKPCQEVPPPRGEDIVRGWSDQER